MDIMKRLFRSGSWKIFLIPDNHSVHKAKKSRAWVDWYRDKIDYFLPGL